MKSTFDNVANGTGIVEEEGEEAVKAYTVTFKGDKGNVIKTVEVAEGENATPPEAPTKEGHTFTGWKGSFENVKGDVEVTPEFKINTYSVKFLNADGSTISTQAIEHGGSASAPRLPSGLVQSSHFEAKWDNEINNITSNTTISAFVDLKSEYESYAGTIDVRTPYELQAIGNKESSLNKRYVQRNDINLSSINNFKPIGESSNRFTGEYDGAGFVIKNLTVDQSSNHAGLFGYSIGSTLKNIGLEDISVKGQSEVGGLVGYLTASGEIFNCYAKGTVEGSGSYTGGLVGCLGNVSNIRNSYAIANVTGGVSGKFTGGLVGRNVNSSRIYNSYSKGNVTGHSIVGGFVGESYSNIVNSHTTAKVVGSGVDVGGFIGVETNSSGVDANSSWAKDVNMSLPGVGKDPNGIFRGRGLSKSNVEANIKALNL